MKRQTGSVIGLLLMVCATAIAQEDPNSAGFHARHNTNSPYYDGGAQQAPAPPPVWADRWGAISFDGEKQVVGVSADMTSKRKAQETSVSDCKSRGGVGAWSRRRITINVLSWWQEILAPIS
ncbi:hypothetical protein WJ977_21015 [Achromobacter xylosoxidans]